MRDTEIKKMHEMFIEFDLQKNGVITVEEMKQLMHEMGYFFFNRNFKLIHDGERNHSVN